MGCEKLWSVIEEAGQRTTLRCLAIQHLQAQIVGGQLKVRKPMVIGVDMGTFMTDCSAAARKAGLHLQSLGGLFRPMYYRLCFFLKIPATFVFVYDGPLRPSIKRNKKVQARGPFWETPSKTLIKAFGFAIHQAPGEAEAELALLNRWGNIDAVLTADSDTLVFGAPIVLRSLPAKQRDEMDDVEFFSSQSIQSLFSLSPDRLVFYALAAGGDYSKGIKGCGAAHSSELARSGVGDDLVRTAKASHHGTRETDLETWRRRIVETSQSISLGRHSRNLLLDSIRLYEFPSKEIVDYYTHPTTSFTHNDYLGDSRPWSSVQQPSISNIIRFCRDSMGWTDNVELGKTIESRLLEGLVLRLMYSDMCTWDQGDYSFGLSAHRLTVKSCVFHNGRDVDPIRIEIDKAAGFEVLLQDDSLQPVKPEQPFRVWAPEKVVPAWAKQASTHWREVKARVTKKRSADCESEKGDEVQKRLKIAGAHYQLLVQSSRAPAVNLPVSSTWKPLESRRRVSGKVTDKDDNSEPGRGGGSKEAFSRPTQSRRVAESSTVIEIEEDLSGEERRCKEKGKGKARQPREHTQDRSGRKWKGKGRAAPLVQSEIIIDMDEELSAKREGGSSSTRAPGSREVIYIDD